MDDTQQGSGRTAEFINAARTMQQGAGRGGFHPTSTLDSGQVFATANGMSESDRSRNPFKGSSFGTGNGSSDTTFQTRMYLGSNNA